MVKIETTLRTELNEAFQMMEAKLEQMENECGKYTQRLSVVRQDLLYKRQNMSSTDSIIQPFHFIPESIIFF
jgi:hypothetical protein